MIPVVERTAAPTTAAVSASVRVVLSLLSSQRRRLGCRPVNESTDSLFICQIRHAGNMNSVTQLAACRRSRNGADAHPHRPEEPSSTPISARLDCCGRPVAYPRPHRHEDAAARPRHRAAASGPARSLNSSLYVGVQRAEVRAGELSPHPSMTTYPWRCPAGVFHARRQQEDQWSDWFPLGVRSRTSRGYWSDARSGPAKQVTTWGM